MTGSSGSVWCIRPKRLDPAHAGQANVHDDQIGVILLQRGDTTFGVRKGAYVVAPGGCDLVFEDLPDEGFVFDDE